jgi:hypothetical protein
MRRSVHSSLDTLDLHFRNRTPTEESRTSTRWRDGVNALSAGTTSFGSEVWAVDRRHIKGAWEIFPGGSRGECIPWMDPMNGYLVPDSFESP